MKHTRCILLLLVLVIALPGGVLAAQEDDTYVVATHYPDFAGTDPAPREGADVAYGIYNNRENDYRAVDQAQAERILAAIEAETGVSVMVYNDWNEVISNVTALQIVNNVPVEGALYTIFLPPGWTPDANLPLLLSGNGAGTSNNSRLYGGDISGAAIAAMSVQGGRGGLIAAISNCGGTESQGVDETTLRSVGAFIDFMDLEGGADRTRVVTAGGSRGGGSALVWAANPLDLDYNVVGVFAAVPPTHYGSLGEVSMLTYPSMAGIGVLISHDENAWQYDAAGQIAGSASYLDVIVGTSDVAEANARGPIGMVERLAGKAIVLAAGAHDAYFPLSHFLAYDRALTAQDIPHMSIVTLANGHENSDYFMTMLLLYLDGLTRGLLLPVPSGRFYFIDTDPGADAQESLVDFFAERGIEADPATLPVIVQFPYRAGVGSPVDVEVCGTPGDMIELYAVNEAGDALYRLSAVLPEDECMTGHFQVDAPPGSYTWTLAVNAETISPLNTPARGADGCGIPAVTIISEQQPSPEQTYAYNHEMSFGLDEFSGQPEACTQ
ncbi:MAG: hypothetical protein JW910_15490 [Anaerolineae bacterium]|nr:hypothetical protein [Anaerolineae bacterium]